MVDMTKVYVVRKKYDYDSPELVGVYSSSEKAIEIASFKQMMKNESYVIIVFDIDTEHQDCLKYQPLTVNELSENHRCQVEIRIEDIRRCSEKDEADSIEAIREKEKLLESGKDALQKDFEADMKDLKETTPELHPTSHTDRDKIL